MDVPGIFKITPKGLYRCVCNETFDNIDDALFHINDDGFCENGMRLNDNNKYECKCGVENMSRSTAEFKHYYENKGKCITRKEVDILTTCEICNKQFHHISWYERHCNSQKHKTNMIYKTERLDLTCKICNITCSSQNQIKAHFETPKHKERELTKQIQLDLECAICKIKCRGQKEMQIHLQTKKHLKLSRLSI